MHSALIGHTGFVGSNLARQHPFSALFHSRNIDDIRGQSYDLAVCAGVQAKKWWANQNPEEDWAGIERLLHVLATVQARRFVLISTIDVYPVPRGVDEETPITPDPKNPYGVHRWTVENRLRAQFADCTVIRLPGLFGTGLRKNVVFDLLHDNQLEVINPESVFQYYFLDRLWADLERATAVQSAVVNFATEPLPTKVLTERFFPMKAIGQKPAPVASYDMRTRFAQNWGGEGGYLYDQATVLSDLGEFIERERLAP